MTEFFNALNNFRPVERKKPIVVIDGKEMEVSKEVFKKVEQHGAENFKLVDGKIRRIPPKIFKKTYFILRKADEGYIFNNHDPYWPESYGEGGFVWEDESELLT
jgi:hypothetical protein